MTTKKELLRVIRKRCLFCTAGQPSIVRHCDRYDCDSYPYRMGTDPNPSSKGFRKKAVDKGDQEPD